jgi:hypothetical protein
MLVRLLYASRVVDPEPAVIESILAQSRQFNPSTGITGILVYSGDIFLQAIEGGREAVSELYGHIQKDARHKQVVLLGQVDVSRVNTSILLKYSERAVLDPYSVSGVVSLALLEELMATASIIGRA